VQCSRFNHEIEKHGTMKSRVRSNKPFNYYSRPYPSGFHAFQHAKEERTSSDEVDLSQITLPASGTPWDSQTCSWTLNAPHAGVMEFTGTTTNPSGSGLITQQTKRKIELNCPIPVKQQISDERMAAHFKSLSISLQDSDSDDDQVFASTSISYKARRKTNRSMTAEQLQESIKNAKKFTVSEEVLKFNKTTDTLLPHLLQMEKPCTALIPWKPLLSIEELVHKNEQPVAAPENDEDLGILVDFDEDNNNLDFVNLNNNNLGQNQNDFDMDMD